MSIIIKTAPAFLVAYWLHLTITLTLALLTDYANNTSVLKA